LTETKGEYMDINIAYAGDRKIAVDLLRFILKEGVKPKALFVSSDKKASHDDELIELCSHLDNSKIFRGKEFKEENSVEELKSLKLDYIISIHFPYIYPKDILDLPAHGVINLHPAYLPFNRGWHTPTWAIYEDTPYGATMHFMDEDVDCGDIINREKVEKKPEDTANSLYKKVLNVEKKLFKDTWKDLINFEYDRIPQELDRGTKHHKEGIKKIQRLKLDEKVKVEELIRKLRALTTNKISEAAYFEKNGNKYRVQINIEKED